MVSKHVGWTESEWTIIVASVILVSLIKSNLLLCCRCKNRLTPYLFLYVLMRVSRIWVVSEYWLHRLGMQLLLGETHIQLIPNHGKSFIQTVSCSSSSHNDLSKKPSDLKGKQFYNPQMSSSCQKTFVILTFTWPSPDLHLTFTWPSYDLPRGF